MTSVLRGCQRKAITTPEKGGPEGWRFFACVYLNRFSWSGLVQKCSTSLLPV